MGRRNGNAGVGVDFFIRVKKRNYISRFYVRASLMEALSVWLEGACPQTLRIKKSFLLMMAGSK
jgi:hypothetical protein